VNADTLAIRPVDADSRLPVEATAELLVDNWYPNSSSLWRRRP
jgi:hypothetical protein